MSMMRILLFFATIVGGAAQDVSGAPSAGSEEHARSAVNSFFAAAVPQEFSQSDFAKAVAAKLEPAEVGLVVNPLTYTPQMQSRARELTAAATNEAERARLIFDLLVRGGNTNLVLPAKPETAREAYEAWDASASQLGCQESAFLYVALTRALNLKTYYVFVERDFRGVWLLHGCAAFFTGTNALLVDPAYGSFGAPHKTFAILDDVETAGVYLACKPGLKELRAAVKLAPRVSLVRATLIDALATENRWDEVRRECRVLEGQDPESPLTCAARARAAIHQGEIERAVDLLTRAITLAPETYLFRCWLGRAYQMQNRWSDAGKCFEQALPFCTYQAAAEAIMAAGAFARGAERQAAGDWGGAFAGYDEAVRHGPNDPEFYLNRAYARHNTGDFDQALADYEKAIQLGPGLATSEFYLGRGKAHHYRGEVDAALADYERALELDPTMLRATHMLAILRYDRHEFSLAARDLRKVVDLIPGNDYLRFRLFLACSWLGDAKHAAEELQAHLDNRGPTKKSDWTSIVGDFLLGRMAEVEFLKAAENSDAKTTLEQRCEAFYYAGSQRLLKGGETVTAAKYFQACLDTGVKRFTEYGSARIELNLLKALVHE